MKLHGARHGAGEKPAPAWLRFINTALPLPLPLLLPLLAMPPRQALAQNDSAVESEAALAPRESGSADGVTGTIHGRNRIFRRPGDHVLLPHVITDSLEAGLKKSTEWLGIESAFTYDALAMGAINNHADWGALSGDATLSLHWQINKADGPRPLEIAARIRDRETLGGGFAPSELRAATGAIWGYVHGYTNAGWEIPDLYLEQHFFQKRLMTRYGQMSIDDLLDDYSVRSAKTSFLNEAFSYSPAVGLPGTGLGILGRWTSPRGWDLTFAASNVESTALNEEADWRFKADALFEAVQLAYRFEGFEKLPARIQLLAWNADALPEFDLSAGNGASLTLEQQWPDKWNTWLRYAWSDGEAAKAAQLITTGLSLSMGRDGQDRMGIAIAAGESSRDSGNWQKTLEVFYRWQAGPVQITPDIQINTGDHLGGNSDWLLVAGLRVGFTF